jgi:nitrogen fixation NifU-like protein
MDGVPMREETGTDSLGTRSRAESFENEEKVNKSNDLDRFAHELQKQILEQIKKQYSEVAIDHWQNPRNFKRIENPDVYAKVTGPCGDSMEMFLHMKDNTISECGFQTDGCGTTIICGSVVMELAQKKSITQALSLVSADRILEILGGLPDPDVHCAQLAAETMRKALADYISRKTGSRKKH